MQKFTGLFLFLLGSLFCCAQTQVPTADEVLKPVYAQAVKENKKVLLIFHASWCVWCHKLDTALQDRVVQPLMSKNYITTHLTVYESKDKKNLENPGALQFLTKHGGADLGIPYWFVLDKEGNVLADSKYKPDANSGCPATEEEIAHFISVLRKTSSLNEDHLKLIKKRFQAN